MRQFTAGMLEWKALMFCARAARKSYRSYLRVIGPRKNKISRNEANKEGSKNSDKRDKIYGTEIVSSDKK